MKALETRARTLTLDDAGLEDLRTIAQRKAGKGEALQRMLDRAELTHASFAAVIDVQRATVSSWTREDRWPNDRDLKRVVGALGISTQILKREWQATHQDDIDLAFQLKSELDFLEDPIDRFILIADTLEEQIFIKQGFKGQEDTRAAEYFTTRADMYREVHRKRSVQTSRSVNGSQASWASGTNVYAKALRDAKASESNDSQSADDIALAQAQALGIR